MWRSPDPCRGARHLFLLCSSGALLAHPPCAQDTLDRAPAAAPAEKRDTELAARLDDYLNRSAAFGFSGVVLVAKAGRIVLCKGYGIADRASGTPFTADTAIDLGSVTKQITAAAILKLEMLGKLRTDASIAEFLEGVPADKSSITIHHLLTHTSGLARGEGDRTESISRDAMVARILATPLIAEVGARFSYSNHGYTLLAAVIEHAAGRTFQSFLREQFFDPLGMSRTGFYGDTGRWRSGPVACSYFETALEGRPLDWPLTWAATGGGHVMTTAPDLFRWDCELRSGTILSTGAKQRLITGYVEAEPPFAYGYGWRVAGGPGARLAFHTGYYQSFGCEYRRYLDRDTTVFVATNVGYLGGTGAQVAVSDPIASIALGAEAPMPPVVVGLDAGALRRVCGAYRSASGARLDVRMDHGHLVVDPAGQEAFDALFDPDERRAQELAASNERSAALIAALRDRDAAALARAAGGGANAEMLETTWSSLVQRFGKLQRFEVLGTAPYPFHDVDVRSYVKLELERSAMLVTVGYRGGAFFDLTTWDDAPNPAALALAPLSADVFTTYDLSSGRATKLAFHAMPAGAIDGVIVGASSRQHGFERAR